MSQKKSCSTKFFFGKSPDEIFFWKKMRKLAKCRALTSAFGGSIPGGWAGVFRRKTLEKRRKCSCDSVTCSKPSAKRENVGVWGHSPQEKFAVSNVRGALCRSRSVWSRRCPVVVVRRVCPHAVRPFVRRRRVRPRPDDEQGRTRRLGACSGRRPPDPEGSPEPQQKHGCGRARWHSTQFASTTGPQFLAFFKP